jgi:hypothetical protein
MQPPGHAPIGLLDGLGVRVAGHAQEVVEVLTHVRSFFVVVAPRALHS